MPRASSVIRKNLPRRSSVDSFSSSQFGILGYRNPLGGGPDGVAYDLRASRTVGVAARMASAELSARGSWWPVASAIAERCTIALEQLMGFLLNWLPVDARGGESGRRLRLRLLVQMSWCRGLVVRDYIGWLMIRSWDS